MADGSEVFRRADRKLIPLLVRSTLSRIFDRLTIFDKLDQRSGRSAQARRHCEKSRGQNTTLLLRSAVRAGACRGPDVVNLDRFGGRCETSDAGITPARSPHQNSRHPNLPRSGCRRQHDGNTSMSKKIGVKCTE